VENSLLEVKGLHKGFGALKATDGVDLEVLEGETHAIIGPNGAGKTTSSASLPATCGRTRAGSASAARTSPLCRPRSAARRGLARSFQITSVYPEFSALENVALAVQAQAGHSFRFWKPARGDASLTEPARHILDEVGLSEKQNMAAGNLAHGEQRQLEVAMVLATRPRLLLLDEPMAGMGHEESQRMIALLAALKRRQTIVLVEHDMDAVFRLADRISVLVYGRIIATGSPEQIRMNEEVRKAYLGEDA